VRKEAKRLGVTKPKRRDPGIPNNWPFKAQMLADMERAKEKKEEDLLKRRQDAKTQAVRDKKHREHESKENAKDRDANRKATKAALREKVMTQQLRLALGKSDVLLEVLDSRDPLGCRCAALEAWAVKEGKRLILVLTKADLVPTEVTAQWLQLLGTVGPVVAVSPEGGREGISDLLRLLGHAPPSASSSAAVPASGAFTANAVGIVGYPATGKKALLKALRQESKSSGPAAWLLDAVGLLSPAQSGPDANAALHLAVRSALPKAAAGDAVGEPEATVTALLARTQAAALMRRFRLPAFEGTEAFLRAFCKDRSMKSKRGKDAPLETVARRVLLEISTAPGCQCMPPASLEQGAPQLWTAHGSAKASLEAVILAQLTLLKGRGASPPGSLALTSATLGATVDLDKVLADVEGEAEVDMAASDDGDDDESSDGEGDEEEGEGEESDMEGDESEMED